MKRKKLGIIILLLIMTIALYAGEAPLDVSTLINFRCTSTWGYNLETDMTGFETVVNWFEFIFTPTGYKTQKSKPGSMDESYSFFSVTGLDLKIMASPGSYEGNDVDADIRYDWMNFTSMAAKLITPWVWFGIIFQGNEANQIWNYHQFISDRAMIGSRTAYKVLWGDARGTATLKDAPWTENLRDQFQSMYDPSGRLLIGYEQELFSIIGKIGSRYTWMGPSDTEDYVFQEYAFGIDTALRLIDGLEIGFDAYGTTYIDKDEDGEGDGDPMFSAKATYDIPLYKTLYIQPYVGIDAQVRTRGTNMEIAGGINMPWPGGGWMEDPIYILSGDNNGSPSALRGQGRYTKQNTFGGITLGASFYIPAGEDPGAAEYPGDIIGMIDLSIFEARGDEGLYKNLGLTLTAQMFNLLGTIEFGIAAYADYEILNDTFLPFLAVQYQDYDEEYPDNEYVDNLNLHIGIQYIQIKNATIGIEYGSGNLLVDESVEGTVPEWGVIYAFLSLIY